jgi:hypothetical protein
VVAILTRDDLKDIDPSMATVCARPIVALDRVREELRPRATAIDADFP